MPRAPDGRREDHGGEVAEVTTRIYRYEVPVDDRWHIIRSGPPLHVACRQLDTVEFWAPSHDDTVGSGEERHFRVYGTGHEIPDGVLYVGTAIAPGGSLVWHLHSDVWKVAS